MREKMKLPKSKKFWLALADAEKRRRAIEIVRSEGWPMTWANLVLGIRLVEGKSFR